MENLPEFISNHLFLCALFAALVLLFLWSLFGDTISGTKPISPSEMTHLINRENAVVLDLRKANEFKEGHIINAINIPHTEIEASVKKLEKHKKSPVVLYCQLGNDSPGIVKSLKQSGFENISFLKGGLMAWQNANLPIAK